LGGIWADNTSEERKEGHTEDTLGEAIAILKLLYQLAFEDIGYSTANFTIQILDLN